MSETKRAFLAAILVTLSGSPALAQDGSEPASQRTVEGAQRFLSELASSSDAYIEYSLGTFRFPKKSHDMQEWVAHWAVARVEARSRCLTRIYVRPGTAAANYSVDPPIPAIEHIDVDWSRAGEIGLANIMIIPGNGKHGNYVSTDVKYAVGPKLPIAVGGGNWLTIGYMITGETVERLRFATAFLKANCEVKSDTGF